MNSGLRDSQGLQNEYTYESKIPKPSKPRFEVVLIIGGKKRELTNKGKGRRDDCCNEDEKYQEKKLGTRVKKMKAALRGKFPIDVH